MATLPPSAAPTLDLYGQTVLPSPTPIDAFQSFSNDPTETNDIFATPTTFTSSSSPSNNEDQNNKGILNYYFLLLALLLILLGILYLLFARRQRQKIAQRRQNGQRALARDLERWGGGGPWGPGRFRMPRTTNGTRQPTRREEGLDERGEAPPPYIPKEPERAFAGDGVVREIPLQDLSRMDHKPPDYDEGSSSSRTIGHGTRTTGMGPMMRGE
ncbi:MAG: hypothetical protein Q9186_001904 [Xanthomendoza sp. 1 TL-2023]